MAGPAAPAMATPDQRSAGNTFSIDRWLMRLPRVARRSPAMTTPSAVRMATTVVPWVIVSGFGIGPETLGGSVSLCAQESGEVGPGI